MGTIFRMCLKVMIIVIMKGLLSSQILFGQGEPVFPTDWIYQKAVSVSGTGTDLTDFQVRVTLTGGPGGNFEFPKAQNNGGDIRFLDDNRSTELSYWIESWIFPSSATIWVNVPYIPSGGKTIYLCYGIPMAFDTSNPDIVVSTSSGDNTFLFFDDFNQGTLNPSKWSIVGTPDFSIINGEARITGEGSYDNYVLSTGSYTDFIMEMSVNMTVDANNNCTPAIGVRVEDVENAGDYVNRYIITLRGEDLTGGGGPNNDLLISRYQEGAATNPTEYSVAYDYEANRSYSCRIVAYGTNIGVYLDGIAVAGWNDEGSGVTEGGVSLANFGGLTSNPVDFDNVRVRTYSPVEPVTSLNSEEKEWTGSQTGSVINRDWNLAKNWSPAGVPTFMDNATVPFISNREPFLTGSTFRTYEYTECNNLSIEPGTTLVLRQTGDLTINGDLINNGTIVSVSYSPQDGGSLIVRGASLGTGIVTFRRYLRTELNYGDRHYISSPVGGQTLQEFIQTNGVRIANDANGYRIWKYQETDDSWPIVSSGNFENGHGYNIDQAAGSDGLMIFSGSVVTATEDLPITVKASSPYDLSYEERYALDPLNPDPYGLINHDADIWAPGRSWTAYGGGGWNLLGNPFTSAMDAAAFISYNDGKFDPDYQALYLYDGVNSVYKYAAAIVPGWDEPSEQEGGYWNINHVGNFSDYVHTGQGFFVLAQYDNIDFYFTTSMQQHAHPYLFLLKSASTRESWPGLRLKVKYGDKEKSTLLVYNDGMTLGLDKSYDVGLLSADPDIEIYTSLLSKDNSVNFTRQAVPLIDFEKSIIPVGIDTEKGGQVTFSANTVALENYQFWLEDRVVGIFTDLTNDTYTVSLPAMTYGTGRFFIVASATTPTGLEAPQMDDLGVRIWTSADKIIIKGEVSNRAICEMYNLHGQKILEVHLNNSEINMISLDPVPGGIYLIRVIDGVKVTTKKTAIIKE